MDDTLSADRKGHFSTKAKNLPRLLIFFFVMTALVFALRLATTTRPVDVRTGDAVAGFDFSRDFVRLNFECFAFFPDHLYTPDDFRKGTIPSSAKTAYDEKTDDVKTEFATYRVVLPLSAGVVYGLAGYSASYAQRLWIDGVECVTIGMPGATAETTQTQARYFTTYFLARETPTEIVIQRANFNHFDEGSLPTMTLGVQTRMTENYAINQMWPNIMIGSMLMAFLFFLGIFLFFNNRISFLWFSLACLLISLRTAIVDHKLIMLLFRDLSWVWSHRIEYLSTLSALFFFYLYLNAVFGVKIRHWVNKLFLLLFGLYLGVVLVTPVIVFTRYLAWVHLIFILYTGVDLLLLISNIRKHEEYRYLEHYLMLLGTLCSFALIGVDVLRHATDGFLHEINLAQLGMTLFVLTNALALVLGFVRTEDALAKAQHTQTEMSESNRMLDRLNTMKTRFMANLGHEMKTPLTVMSVNAQLTKALVKMDADKQEIYKSLDVVAVESMRLARMVSEILDISRMQENVSDMEPLDIGPLVHKTADVYQPLLEKAGNRLILHIERDLPKVLGDADKLIQVVINLLANAGVYTREGEITVSVRRQEGQVIVSVADSGPGITPKLMEHLFERRHGVENGKGSGLGLNICKAILERHCGTIEAQSALGVGTTVWFTLPLITTEPESEASS